MIPDRVSFRYDFIPVPYYVSIFVYMILTKIVFWNESFQNDFIPVVASDRNFRSRTERAVPPVSCKGGTGSFRYGNKQVDWLG